MLTRREAILTMQRGPDARLGIRERERELRGMADDIGMDYGKDIVQKSRTSTMTEDIVSALVDGDTVREAMRRVDFDYLRIMAALNPRQRLFVHCRYRMGLSLEETAGHMGITPQMAKKYGFLVFEALKKSGICADG